MSDSPPVISNWLRRQAALFRLLGDKRSRRDRVSLLIVNIRAAMGWAYIGALVAMLPAAAWWSVQNGSTPVAAWNLLCPLFAAVAVLLGAVIYAPEQRSGTFELVWLACGSGGSFLRLKFSALLAVYTLMAAPVVAVYFAFLPPGFESGPYLKTLFFLLTNAWLLLTTMGLMGTWFAQAWSAGLIGAAFFGVVYLSLGDTITSLNPFLNPFAPGAERLLTMNRVLVIIGGALLARAAASRLRRAF